MHSCRRALEAELSGDFKAAKNIYVNLLKKFETRFEEDSESVELSEGIGEVRVGEDGEGAEAGKVGASMAELAAWDMRQLECRRQLGEWEVCCRG